MQRRANQTTSVRNRLSKNLTPTDRKDIGKVLVDYMIEEDIKAKDIENGDGLIKNLLPMLAKINPDWRDITDAKELAGTTVRSKFMQHIRNLKKKSTSLDNQV